MGSVLSTADDTPLPRPGSPSIIQQAASGLRDSVRMQAQMTSDDSATAAILELEREARLRERVQQLQAPRTPARAFTQENLIELDSITSPTLEGVSHLMPRDTSRLRRRRASVAPKEQKANVLNQEMEPIGIHQVPLDPDVVRQIHREATSSSITVANPFPLTPEVVVKPGGRPRSRSQNDVNNNQQSRPLSRASSDGDLSRVSLSRSSSNEPLLPQPIPHGHPIAQINRIADYVDGVTAAQFAPAPAPLPPFQPYLRIPSSRLSRVFNKDWDGYTIWRGKEYPAGTWQHSYRHTGLKRTFQVVGVGLTIPAFGLISSWIECGKDWGFDPSYWQYWECPWRSSATNQERLLDEKNRTANWSLPNFEYETQVRLVQLTNASKEAAIDRAKYLQALQTLTFDQMETRKAIDRLWAAYNMDPVTGTPRMIDSHPLFQDLLISAPVDMESICKGLKNTPVEVCWGELALQIKCTKRSEATLHYINTHYAEWRWFQTKLMHSLFIHVLNVAPQTRYMDGFNTRRFNRLVLNCRLPIQFPKKFPPNKQPYLFNQLHGKWPIPRDIMKMDDKNTTVRIQLPMRVKREVENYPILPFEFDHPKTLENLNSGKYSYLTQSEAKELRDILYELDDKSDILYAIIIGVGCIIVVILIAGLILRLTIMSRTQRLNAREEELNMRQLALNRREFGTLEFIQEEDEAIENDDGDEDTDEETDSRKQLNCFVETEL